jgi:hypothetical protein
VVPAEISKPSPAPDTSHNLIFELRDATAGALASSTSARISPPPTKPYRHDVVDYGMALS